MAEQVVVSLFPCSFSGDVRHVPVGSRVVVKLGWEAREGGLVQSFLTAQTMTVALDGMATGGDHGWMRSRQGSERCRKRFSRVPGRR